MKMVFSCATENYSLAVPARKISHQFWLTILVLSQSPSQARADVKLNTRSNMLLLIKRLANDPLFPQVVPDSFQVTTSDNTGSVGHVTSLDKKEQLEGIIETQDAVLGFPESSAYIESLEVIYRIRIPPRSAIAKGKIQQLAFSFSRVHFAPFWRVPGEVKLSDEESPIGNAGVRTFRWKKQYKGLDIANLSIDVRIWDGKIVKAFYSTTPDIASSLAKVRTTPSEAKKKFLQHAQSSNGDRFTKFRVDSLNLLLFGEPSRLSYLARLNAENRQGVPVTAVDVLDAVTGDYLIPNLAFSVSPQEHVSILNVEDGLPIWTKQGLSFISNRKLAGMPSWAVFGPQLFLQNATGQMSYLTSDMAVSPSFASGLSNSSWLAFERAGWTYGLDLNTGDYRVLGQPERRGMTPAIDSSGLWSIIAGTAHGGGNVDLMADNLKRGEKLQLRGRLMLREGDEHDPAFSPDGKWLYFISTKEGKEGLTHALRRLPIELAHALELKELQEDQAQTLVASLPDEVRRLSVFPNGERLLLQTRKGMLLVNVADGKVSSLSFNNLKDSELGGLPIEDVTDGWAGPTDDEVTFSGYTKGPNKKEPRRIYSCRFDGSALKAWTSAADVPVSAHKFSVDKKNALNLAKHWALDEIQFAAEQKRLLE